MTPSKTGGQTVVGDLTRDLYEAAAAVREVGESLARAAGQSLARWQVLYLLGEQALTVPTIARRLGVARQSVQRIADELVEESLVARSANPDHQRSPLHALTREGLRVLEHINHAAASWHREVLERIPEREIQKSSAFLKELTRVAAEGVRPRRLEPRSRRR